MAYELVDTTTRETGRLVRLRQAAAQLAGERVNPRVAFYAICIFVLSALDAAFTLTLIDLGIAHEFNLIMRVLLEHDTALFLNVKLGVTGGALVVLAACAERAVFGRIRVVQVLRVLTGLYALLVTYEICLLLISRFA